jgi:hypothetical protein
MNNKEESVIMRVTYNGNPEVIIDVPLIIGGDLTRERIIDRVKKTRPEVKHVQIVSASTYNGLN